MENTNSGYKVGDWILLEDSFIQKALNRNADSVYRIYCYPQKIQAISREGIGKKRIILKFSPKRKWMLDENVFRLATEKEIKEQNIKNIFL